MKRAWRIFSSVFTIAGLVVPLVIVLLRVVPLPLFEQNSATLMARDVKTQVAVARALSVVIGEPTAEFNTDAVHRFLFRDGTSVDYLVRVPEFKPMYPVTSLKSVVLSFFSGESPTRIAKDMRDSLRRDGYRVQIVTQPDPAFPDGSIVLVLSDVFQDESGAGFGIIVRKNALRVGGPQPTRFSGWLK